MKLHLIARFDRYPYVVRLLFIVTILLLTFGTIIHFVEPNQFPTIFDGVWWAIITTSTIGYGDYVPKTILGRSIGMILVLVGVGFVSTYFVTLASSAVKKQNAIMKGTFNVNLIDHIVIIGWNERSKEIIQYFLKNNDKNEIVLIDSTLEESPFLHEKNAYFLKGTAYSEDILKQANVNKAKLVLITAEPTQHEINSDMQTILNIVSIKGFAKDVYVIAEILTNEQIVNAKRAGADEVIPTNQFSSSIMLQSITKHGSSSELLDFLQVLKEVHISFHNEQTLAGKTFEFASQFFLKENKLLIGLHRNGKTYLSPHPKTIIAPNDQLLIIYPDQNVLKNQILPQK